MLNLLDEGGRVGFEYTARDARFNDCPDLRILCTFDFRLETFNVSYKFAPRIRVG
jgi:hypothetical protein